MNKLDYYYQILGLPNSATPSEIKQAYYQLVKIWHPDNFYYDSQLKQKAEEELIKINEAYQILKQYSNPVNNDKNYIINFETYYNQGIYNFRNNKYEEALENFDMAIRLNPNYVNAYKYRGYVCEKLGYYNRSQPDFIKAFKLTSPHYQEIDLNVNYSPVKSPMQTNNYDHRIRLNKLNKRWSDQLIISIIFLSTIALMLVIGSYFNNPSSPTRPKLNNRPLPNTIPENISIFSKN